MKRVLSISVCIIALVAFAAWAPNANAYEQYHAADATNTPDQCYQCHGYAGATNPTVGTAFEDASRFQNDGFDGRGPLHDMHVSPITGTCNLCHISTGDVPFTYTSGATNGQGCRGCHGVDNGTAFGWGAGLRAHHANAGAPADLDGFFCADCHGGDPAPSTEDIVPVYYLRADVNAKDPCNADGTEDWGTSSPFDPTAPDGFGLDNDGNLLYDADDPACATGPGPELLIQSQIPAVAGATVTVPVDFTQNTSDINSTAFSVDYDENNLTIDPTITMFPWPDAITIHPDILNASFFWTIEIFLDAADIDGELDVLFTSSSQLVPEGDLITITFDAANVGSTTEAAVNFSQNPIASFGNTVGDSVAGTTVDGSVLITGSCTPTGTSETICNGVDDDCDGAIDEDYVSTPTTCGVGECAATGQMLCNSDGTTVDTCVEGAPSTEVCDNLDNDCDGAIDDNLTRQTTCGVGECAGNIGTETCSAGTWGNDTCDPLAGATAEICDNLDNDCDGSTDENLTRPTTCGVGECAGNTGEETCSAGTWGGDTCDPLAGATAEICDNFDNDCDGSTDENLTRPTTCGVGECAGNTGEETCSAGTWGGDTCDPLAGATAEICDNLDNDCDGSTDENLTRPTTCGVGECAGNTGEETCSAGTWGGDTCDPLLGATAEICDNLDNDCDGATDENLTRPSTCGVGECAGNTGEETCSAGTWGGDTCDPLLGATAEICDNLDNDCDGATDENLTRPTTCGVGECAGNTGEETCSAGMWGGDTCDPLLGATAEICDNLDNDCDGATDENLTRPTTCGVGECAGNTGEETCSAGMWGGDTCDPLLGATAEICDNLDNDCDGATDENLTRPTTCGVGECAGNTGEETCSAGMWGGDTCDPLGGAVPEVCDNLDNDCDGATDENLTRPTTCGVGECAGNTGQETCSAGMWGNDTCDPNAGAVLEGPPGDGTCSDTVDNDCDGLTDLADPGCEIVCTPTGVPETLCNGVDDDCDGAIDEDYMSTQTTCGVGECLATGETTCIAGVEGDTCIEGTPSAEVCDNLDNDCDGSTDEDLTRGTTCGVGECADNTGQETCSAGMWGGDTCDPLAGATAEVCDNLDNDCDGSTDENLTRPTTCGVGACADNTGTETCSAGTWGGDTCDPLAGALPEGPFEDPTCSDAVDNDCDGLTDLADPGCEEVCTPTGVSETLCNGVDDDCDGGIDEDYTSTQTTCGVGECASTGQTTCVGGVEEDSCTPGTPAADDSTCDGLDNDCDGAIDEDYMSMPTTCGVGQCASTGQTTCVGGVEEDSCSPGTPGVEGPPEDPTCSDGIDNDCDGQTDTGDSDCADVLTDLDIVKFRVDNNAKLGRELERIQLTVENPNGGGQEMKPATLIGVQDGDEVYNETRMVFDLSGNGRSRWAFPSFEPKKAGTINWTVTIVDDFPDDDTATASTNVKKK